MAVIFNSRDFLPSFTHRNVVGESSGISTINGELRFRVSVDFGVNGKLLQFASVSGYKKDLTKTAIAIYKYVDDIKSLIAGLTDFNNWMTNEEQDRFLLTVDIARPVMITGTRGARGIRFGIHGEDLFDPAIVVDTRKDPGANSLERKITDIIDVFQKHIDDVINIKIV